jgi:hypothetical protein
LSKRDSLNTLQLQRAARKREVDGGVAIHSVCLIVSLKKKEASTRSNCSAQLRQTTTITAATLSSKKAKNNKLSRTRTLILSTFRGGINRHNKEKSYLAISLLVTQQPHPHQQQQQQQQLTTSNLILRFESCIIVNLIEHHKIVTVVGF